MMEALNLSRILNGVASLEIMRRAFNEAKMYASRRNAFGQGLIKFLMIQETLSNLKAKLEIELATLFDLIKGHDKVTAGKASEAEMILNRLKIALLKTHMKQLKCTVAIMRNSCKFLWEIIGGMEKSVRKKIA